MTTDMRAPRVAAALVAMLLALHLPARSQTSDSVGAAVTAAQVAARSWLTLVDGRRYGESWDSGSVFFRQAVTRPGWEDALHKARSPFETFSGRQLLSASYRTALPQAPPGQYVVIEYRTGAGGGKKVVETVTPMKDQDGQWRVAGYFVRLE